MTSRCIRKTVTLRSWKSSGRSLKRTQILVPTGWSNPHTSNKSLDWIKNHFGSRVISRKCDHEWAPYSPDLSPPDYYLWGFLKDRVYATKPRTLGELKKKIREEMRSISRTTCKSVMQNFVLRLEKCANLNGCHLEHVL